MEELGLGIVIALLLEMRIKLQSNSMRILALEHKLSMHIRSNKEFSHAS